jgi:hypothetical protein
VNGLGAIGLTSLCLAGAIVWWPGIKNWRRSLIVNWRSKFPRINWDLHQCARILVLSISAGMGDSSVYFSFPRLFNPLFLLDPADHFTDQGLFWLSQLLFVRFSWFTEVLWNVLGLVAAVSAFTGVFICCRRMI